ncbi:PP2C family protein-serine/threonine phosphatase [Bradyrhizobium oligotrophicum]|uniref:PP2C family protein-serine/threonine phosphatase n=1 Tax=Bradyrhizobium oligotrophicum TaxID=44255 RepID=UPI003EBEB590
MDDQLTKRIVQFLRSKLNHRGTESAFNCAIATSTGLVRDQNQDAALFIRARYASTSEKDFDLAIVCDGLGGMKHGGEASILGLSTFVSSVVRFSHLPMEDRLLVGMREANDRIFQAFRGHGGTTLSAIAIGRNGSAAVCHVGDSRIYAIGDHYVRQLTHDDTLQGALQRGSSADQDGGQRDTRLLQFVGMGSDLEAHLFRPISGEPKNYLLTSDGAHDIPVNYMQRVAYAARSNSDLARKLIQLSEILGGFDNATAIAMPASIAEAADRPDDGIDLSLMSAFGHLAVWIPESMDKKRGAPSVGEASPANEPLPSSEPPGSENPVDIGNNKRAKLPGSKKKKKAGPSDELPLNEPLTIQFPAPDEGDR